MAKRWSFTKENANHKILMQVSSFFEDRVWNFNPWDAFRGKSGVCNFFESFISRFLSVFCPVGRKRRRGDGLLASGVWLQISGRMNRRLSIARKVGRRR